MILELVRFYRCSEITSSKININRHPSIRSNKYSCLGLGGSNAIFHFQGIQQKRYLFLVKVSLSISQPIFLIPIPSKSFTEDEHVANLLLFHPTTQLHEDEAYTSGKIILQDKASCFPASILAPPVSDNTVAIDATSAPGNKTSHLSALMKNKGKVSYIQSRKLHLQSS